MNVLERFKNEFNELVDITYNTYWDSDAFPKEKYSVILHDTLVESLDNRERTFNLTREDLKQHLSLLWLTYYKQYNSKDKKPETSLRSYMIRRSIWGIRDWLKYETNIVTEEYNPSFEKELESDFKIDLMFLLDGTGSVFLRELSPYERYLIFLKFKEDKSILQMSNILQKDRRVVKNHFDSIISKIKENYSNGLQNKQDTRGYRCQ
jgi:hypothetical protein